ncbi:hypothetical protein [Treponema sp. J25]|uniref:TP0183 family DNA metabolism protein n=1 Tax=Treponema sp. J25 TaxID=2094121 RepID=UPI0010516B2C|nr:hypothetical protein [Treponema sp. J25]MCX7656758.1 hypothetical protein [Treponemataceae bacterium]TCW60831.1 hypothetical protein C5O22_09250 [Treponema sp. J25]
MKGRILPLFVWIVGGLMLFAQENASKPIMVILPFSAVTEYQEETKTLEKLIAAYVIQEGQFTLALPGETGEVPKTQGESLDSPSDRSQLESLFSAQYIITGSVGKLGNKVILTLERIKLSDGQKITVSGRYATFEELLSHLSPLLEQLVWIEKKASPSGSETKEPITEELLIGSWWGDRGIEMVRLFSGGKGQAILTSGAKMELSYSIQPQGVKIWQSSPNQDRFYHPVPYKVAQQLVDIARPMEWEFTIYEGGKLKGIKRATAVRYEGETIIEVIHGSVREAEWTKIGR